MSDDDRGIKEDALQGIGFDTPQPIGDYKFLQNRIDGAKEDIEDELNKKFQNLTAEKFIKKKESSEYNVRVNADREYVDVWLKGRAVYGCKIVSADSNMNYNFN